MKRPWPVFTFYTILSTMTSTDSNRLNSIDNNHKIEQRTTASKKGNTIKDEITTISKQENKRKRLSISEKLDIIQCIEAGWKSSDLAAKYKLSLSCINTIKHNRFKLMTEVSHMNSYVLNKKKSMKSPANKDLDDAVIRWLFHKRCSGEPVTGPLLCSQALFLNSKLNGSANFKASKGWLDRFRKRHGLKQLNITDTGTKSTDSIENPDEFVSCFVKEDYVDCEKIEIKTEIDIDDDYNHGNDDDHQDICTEEVFKILNIVDIWFRKQQNATLLHITNLNSLKEFVANKILHPK